MFLGVHFFHFRGLYVEVVLMTEEMNGAKGNGKVFVPINEKYMLSIREASEYFNIGVKKMRRLAEDNLGRFAVYSGNRYLIIRTKFEKFIEESSAV